LASGEQFEKLIGDDSQLVVLFFWASWHPPCAQMAQVATELAKEHSGVKFLQIDTDKFSDIAEKYPVQSVPTFVFLKSGKQLEVIEGANAPKFVSAVSRLKGVADENKKNVSSIPTPGEDLNSRLSKLIRAAPVMLFMKGSPDEPRCGFSRDIISVLRGQKIEFSHFDILTDQTVREGLKKFSNWPTYPQLYVEGELMGGVDVVKEMVADGELLKKIPKIAKKTEDDLNERLKALVASKPAMMFMKGTPTAPQCGFSAKAVEIVQKAGFKDFGHFNILEDQTVREGLKKYSNWPTYPQFYVKGELVGGVDVLADLEAEGELARMAASMAPK